MRTASPASRNSPRPALFAGLLLLAGLFPGTASPVAPDLRSSLDLRVPQAPAPVDVGGETRLVYELHLTNFSEAEVLLRRIEVLDARRGTTLATFADPDLGALLAHPGLRANPADPRVIAPGTLAVCYFWLALPRGTQVPPLLTHRVSFELREATGETALAIQGGTIATSTRELPVLGPPLRGGPWVAVYDPSMARGHRRVLLATAGRAVIPARFAIDWFKVSEDGKLAQGDAKVTANWYGYGADVLAVAKGTVRAVRDDLPESAAVSASRRRNPLQDASGNFLVLDLGGGRYAFYEHLKPGSIRVHAGSRVVPGQVIAALGFSGDSTGPHLHFHVADGPSPVGSEGLPYLIRDFEVLGDYESVQAFGAGQPWTPAHEPHDRRSGEFPLANSVVRFAPDSRRRQGQVRPLSRNQSGLPSNSALCSGMQK